MATVRSLGAGGPPLAYRLDEVSVRLTRQPGSGTFPKRRVTLSGTGTATLERDGQTLPFSHPPGDVLALLNDLYRIRFFDLPTNLNVRYSVFLKDDGSIGTSVLRMLDASSTSVCLRLAAFEKCVTYASGGARELEEIVERVFSQAGRSVDLRPSGK